MAALVLDPYLLAVPAVAEGREVAEQYVASIVDWSMLTGEPWVAVQTPRDTVTALCEAGCYPMTDAVTSLCRAHGLDQFSPEDVADALARLLQSSAVYEDASRVTDVLVDPCTLVPAKPDPRRQGSKPSDGRNSAAIHAATQKLFAMHALLLNVSPEWAVNRHAVTLDPFCNGQGVEVSGTFTIIERDEGCVLPDVPDPYALPPTRVLAREGRDAALRALDPVTLWTEVATTEAREAAIQIAAMRRDPRRSWTNAPTFRLGCEFNKSLTKYNFHNDPKSASILIQACVETVLDINLKDCHHLREGDGGNEPQRSRGVDKAWRRWISDDFRLHYWKSPGGFIEFANVVIEQESYIPYCGR